MNTIQNYQEFISRYIDISDDIFQGVARGFSVRHYQQGDIILHQGEICKQMLFLTEGEARAFVLDAEGNEKTWMFYFNIPQSSVVNLFTINYQKWGLEFSQFTGDKDFQSLGIILEQNLYHLLNMGIGTVGYIDYNNENVAA